MRRTQKLLLGAVMACGMSIPVVRAQDAVRAPDAVPLDPAPRLTETHTTDTRTEVRTHTNNSALSAPDADDVRKSVAGATENAFTKGDFKSFTKYFVDADQKRIGDFKAGDNFAKLDGRLDQFHKDWKAKYNQDFDPDNAVKAAYNDSFARIVQGEIGEARTASGKEMPSNEPANVKGGTPDELKRSGVNQPDANSSKAMGGDTNRESGRNIATVIIPGGLKDMKLKDAAGQAAKGNFGTAVDAAAGAVQNDLVVPMIHQMPDSWKIDVPDSIDGQRLYDNLLRHITMFDEDRSNWPADVNEAYRSATRHVLAATMETGNQGM
jgi:hypothetical protein